MTRTCMPVAAAGRFYSSSVIRKLEPKLNRITIAEDLSGNLVEQKPLCYIEKAFRGG